MNARTVLCAALGALAVTAVMAPTTSARADDYDRHWHHHEWRPAFRPYFPVFRPYVVVRPPAYYVPPPVYYAPPPPPYGYGW
jgi:hypothetical protein